MAWYWQVIIAVVIINVDLVLAVLLAFVIVDNFKGNTTQRIKRTITLQPKKLRASSRSRYVMV